MSKRSSLSRASTGLIMQEAKHNSLDNFTAMMVSEGHPDGSLRSARLAKSPKLQIGETCSRAFRLARAHVVPLRRLRRGTFIRVGTK